MSIYTPYYSLLTGITQAQYATASFSANHSFIPGEIVSFRVSQPNGMVQINNVEATVLSITPSTITVNVDSTYFEPFVYPPVGKVQYLAMCVPSASGVVTNITNITNLAPPTGMNLQDVYDNVPEN